MEHSMEHQAGTVAWDRACTLGWPCTQPCCKLWKGCLGDSVAEGAEPWLNDLGSTGPIWCLSDSTDGCNPNSWVLHHRRWMGLFAHKAITKSMGVMLLVVIEPKIVRGTSTKSLIPCFYCIERTINFACWSCHIMVSKHLAFGLLRALCFTLNDFEIVFK